MMRKLLVTSVLVAQLSPGGKASPKIAEVFSQKKMRNFDQKSESAPENCPTAGSADAESGVVFSSSFTGFTEITNFVNSSVFPIAPINVSEEPANTAKPIVYPSKPLGDFETQVFGYLDLFKNMLHDSISLAVVYHKDSQSAKGLMVLWAASTLSRTSSASARQLQDDLQAATPLVHNAAIVQTIQPVVNSSVNVFALGLVNSRRVADVIVSTETALKQAVLVNRASVVITKNIVLTSTLTISSGTVTIDGQGEYSLDGNGIVGCLNIAGWSTAVTINGLTIKNGFVSEILSN